MSRGCGLVVLGIQTSVFQPGRPIGVHRGGLCCGLVSQGPSTLDPLPGNPLWLLTWRGFPHPPWGLGQAVPFSEPHFSHMVNGASWVVPALWGGPSSEASGFDAGKRVDFLKKTSHHLSPSLRPYCLHPFSTQEAWHLLFWGLFIGLFLATPCGLQDHSFPTKDQTWALAVKAPSSNHQTSREFPIITF